jgi:hypothetical protein
VKKTTPEFDNMVDVAVLNVVMLGLLTIGLCAMPAAFSTGVLTTQVISVVGTTIVMCSIPMLIQELVRTIQKWLQIRKLSHNLQQKHLLTSG